MQIMLVLLVERFFFPQGHAMEASPLRRQHTSQNMLGEGVMERAEPDHVRLISLFSKAQGRIVQT
jgi:hypothetical protein